MYNIVCRNAHEGVLKCVDLIKRKGVEFNSRNGKVRRLTKPLCIEYQKPLERFEFWQEYRDSNPFFLIFEALWMLNGNNNVSFVDYFAPMALYSDDGETLNGAYGFRWRNHFKFDQIDAVIKILKEDKESRRAVIYMGSGDDLKEYSKDYCCNMCISFDVQNDSLNMTVYNRSNDCLQKNEILLSKKGEFTIEELCDKFKNKEITEYKVISYNEETKEFEEDICNNVWEVGEKELLELEFSNGYKVKCTPDHKFLTKNRGWVEAKYLNEEDNIIEYKSKNQLAAKKRWSIKDYQEKVSNSIKNKWKQKEHINKRIENMKKRID